MMTELQDWCGLSYTEDIVLGEEEVEFHVGQAVGRKQSSFISAQDTSNLTLTSDLTTIFNKNS